MLHEQSYPNCTKLKLPPHLRRQLPPLNLAFIALQTVILIAQDEGHAVDQAARPAAYAVDVPAPAMGAYCFVSPPQPGPGQPGAKAEQGKNKTR